MTPNTRCRAVCLNRISMIGITKAQYLITPLMFGLQRLRDNPEGFKVHNPQNGWGDYDGLVGFVARYLDACKKYPEAMVRVSR